MHRTVLRVRAAEGMVRAPIRVTFRDQTGYFTALWFRTTLPRAAVQARSGSSCTAKILGKDRRVVTPRQPRVRGSSKLTSWRRSTWVSVVPIYPLTEGVFQRQLRVLPARRRHRACRGAPDILPEALRRRRNLLPAVRGVPHGPLQAAGGRGRRPPALRLRGLPRAAGRPGPPTPAAGAGARAAALRPRRAGRALAARSAVHTDGGAGRVWSEIRADLAAPVPDEPSSSRGMSDPARRSCAVMALLTAVEAGCQAGSWRRPRSSPSSTCGPLPARRAAGALGRLARPG